MTSCPECGTDFDTVAQEEQLPVMALQQECPSCGYDVGIAVLHYPSVHEVVAPALKGDTCDGRVDADPAFATDACGDGAMIRVQRVGDVMEGRCARHMGAHREAALGLRSEL